MDDVGDLRTLVAETEASDRPEDERKARLDELRSREAAALGEAERRASNDAKAEQAARGERARAVLFSRALVHLRESAVAEGFSEEDVESAGLPSRALLAELAEEGLLEEAVVGIARPWKKELHPRGRGGKFRGVLRGTIPAIRVPQPTKPAPGRGDHPAEHEPDRVEKGLADAKAVGARASGDSHQSNLERKVRSLGVNTEILDEIRAAGLDGDRASRRRRSQLADKLLGRAQDTVELYTDPVSGQWDPSRKQLHDRIVDMFLRERRVVQSDKINPETGLAGTRKELCADCPYLQAPADGKKRALFTAGGNASGKGTALAAPENVGVTPEGAAEIDFDAVKQLLPEFQAMAAVHDIYGTDATHFESAHVARRILHEATERGLNILVDASGDSTTDGYEQSIKSLHDKDYETTIVMVDAALPLAVKSMLGRAAGNGRYVPLPIMARVHQNSVAQHTRWRNSPDIDHWRLYYRGTEGHGIDDMKLVAEGGAKMAPLEGRANPPGGGEAGTMVRTTAPTRAAGSPLTYRVIDQAGYEAVLEKAPGATFENPGASTKPDTGHRA